MNRGTDFSTKTRLRHPIAEVAGAVLDAISTMPLNRRDERRFDELALLLFEKQYAQNPTYRSLCDQKKMTPLTVGTWREIPAVTTSAFKFSRLACFPATEEKVVFHTSGTTEHISGRHYFRTLDFYRAAALRSFKAYCLPDRDKIRMLMLGPTAEKYPFSSLGCMFSEVRQAYGTIKSGDYSSQNGLEGDRLVEDLHKAADEGEPVFILGTSLAVLQLANVLRKRRLRFKLPLGSRLLDTGGYKGRNVEISRAELLRLLVDFLGLPSSAIINEYGMTELSSQFYESKLPGIPLTDARPSIKFASPWTRAVAVDPATLEILPDGEIGMLRIFDLANVDSVIALQTEDLGRAWPDRIELLRRATGAELRGCSLLTESILRMA
jgi:hypothetical protein